ncbi:DUF4190 domain-containing protein [Streptomyces sp. NBC_01481]|uniref:DUF4190 domain-containing protein n=1 Tax=Streptomyces sp. NBC_01481 TaxID=2975869 RepID=UPI00225B4416|nr:DUF4190 domain-containing protein [Streptomyces sp. NBC_01481]MCX4587740.1 DUF4190 domain-containing protein [Streptomyces sp. NBC_01481]
MSDNQAQPTGGSEPRDRDPWAPPESGSAQNRVPLDKPAAQRPPTSPVHDQPTVTSMPGAGPVPDAGTVPPPPIAPGGPAQPVAGPYGYPAAPSLPQPGVGTGDLYGGYPGYPGYQSYSQPGWQAQPANGMGITAMVLGILSICLFCLYGVVSIVLGVLGLIFGILGRKRAQRGEATNGGMALAGIITGSIGIVLGLVVVGLMIWGITKAVNDERNRDDRYGDYSNTLVLQDVAR